MFLYTTISNIATPWYHIRRCDIRG